MIIVDIIIIAVIALCVFFGYQRGLMGVAFKLFSFLLAILLSIVLYIPVSNFVIQHTELDDIIKETIIEKFSDQEMGKAEEDRENSIPEVIIHYMEGTMQEAKNSGIELVAENISITLVKLIVGILLFIVIRIILMFIRLFTNVVEKLPVIKQFNKVGGVLYGILEGFFLIFIVFTIISVISPFVHTSILVDAINQSYIGSILYDYNVLLMFVF